jgi:hypothetical protein
MSAVFATSDVDTLNGAEKAFLAGVFAYQGVRGPPTQEQFRLALAVMTAYAMQVPDNPPNDSLDEVISFRFFRLSDDERLMLTAFAFMRFGVTRPSAWEWETAHQELFGETRSGEH